MMVLSLTAVLCAGNFVAGLGTWWVRYATMQPTRTIAWHAEVAQRKKTLLHDYHALPVELCTHDGHSLAAYWIERPAAQKVVIMCHGHHMVKEQMIKFIDLFPHDSLLLLDFRGHGTSTGERTTLGIHEQHDVAAAIDFVYEKTQGKLDVFGFGFSMGGLPLIKAAIDNNCFAGLILDGAFSNLELVLGQTCGRQSYLPCSLVSLFMRSFFAYCGGVDLTQGDSAAFISQMHVPVLIIHSEDDEITRVEHARALYNAAREPKHLWLVKGSKHGYIIKDHMHEYKRVVDNFCARYSHRNS